MFGRRGVAQVIARRCTQSSISTSRVKSYQVPRIAERHFFSYVLASTLVIPGVAVSHCSSNVEDTSPQLLAALVSPQTLTPTPSSILQDSIRWAVRLLNRLLYLLWTFLPALLTSPALLLPETEINEEWWKLFRTCIQASGPCTTKLAQWISTRPDLFPLTLCAHFQDLQSNHVVPDRESVQPLLAKHYGEDWSNRVRIDRKVDGSVHVLGAGCVAQVLQGTIWQTIDQHRKIERDVAIKIIYPHVKESILVDIEIMRAVSSFLEYWIPGMRQISLLDSVEEFATLLVNQVDMRIEGDNLHRFRKNFNDTERKTMLNNLLLRQRMTSDVHFPEPIREYTNEDILVEEFAPGVLIRDYIKVCTTAEKKQIAAIGLDAIFKMVFLDNFIHADLHPGNIVYAPDEKSYTMQLMFIDAGLAVELQREDRRNLVDLFKAVITNDGLAVGKLMIERSRARHLVQDEDKFALELSRIVSDVHQSGLTLGRLGVSELLRKVLILCFKHQVKLESRFASVIVAMGVVEGLGRQLDPDIDLLKRATPYVMRAALMLIADV